MHRITTGWSYARPEGWKHLETAEVPGIYDAQIADQPGSFFVRRFEMIDKVARQEGLLISPSAAANFNRALKVGKQIKHGHIVTLFADDASKYQEILEKV